MLYFFPVSTLVLTVVAFFGLARGRFVPFGRWQMVLRVVLPRYPAKTRTEDALNELHDHGLAGPLSGADSRVTKYEHRLQETFNFSRGETAVLCVLLLRGRQTPGQLRGRTERLHRFEDLDAVQSSLQKLMQREPPLVVVLPRQPGTKEFRYGHLLCGEVEAGEQALPRIVSPSGSSADNGRVSRLEEAVIALQNEVSELKQQLATFRKQFE